MKKEIQPIFNNILYRNIPIIACIIITISCVYLAKQEVADKKLKLTDNERIKLELTSRNIYLQIIINLSIILPTLITLKKVNDNNKISSQILENNIYSKTAEQFTKAIDQLGNDNLEIRLGAIYALEKIAINSDIYSRQVLEILTAYVREKSYSTTNFVQSQLDRFTIPTTPSDIQAILNILNKRKEFSQKINDFRINLFKSNLQYADLKMSNFRDANLKHTNLKCADLLLAEFTKADVKYANFEYADLSFAKLGKADFRYTRFTYAKFNNAKCFNTDFRSCDLKYAVFSKANLSSAMFWNADLQDADLSYTNLNNTVFIDANLKGANLKDVKNVYPDQIKLAKNWEKAKYSLEFRKKLGLPPSE